MSNSSYISQKIKSLRKSQGITLEQLASSIGKTKSYVSMLENGRATPSLSTLKDISSFFGLTIADFFDRDYNTIENDKCTFDFEVDAELIYSKKGEFNLYLLHKSRNYKMKTYLVELFPNGGYSQALKHDGEEQGFVLEGEIELVLDDERFKLGVHQYFYFDSSKSHKVRNISSNISRILWIYLPK
ncbi:MAG: helix-turn-helix domain-containing protein [Calditerrivibrio sp.]|nr:helix-turn-helix domain-containing protein [Calditerrivibrio sp.]